MKVFRNSLLLFLTCLFAGSILAQMRIRPYVTERSGDKIYYDEVDELMNQKGVKAESKTGKASYSAREMDSYVFNARTNKYDSVPFVQCILFDPNEKLKNIQVGADKREYVPVKLREGKHVLRVYYAQGDTIMGIALLRMSAFPFSTGTKLNSDGKVTTVQNYNPNATEESFAYVLLVSDKMYVLDLRSKPKEGQSDADFVKEIFNDPVVDKNVDYLKGAKLMDIKGSTQAWINIRMHYMLDNYIEL